MDETDKQRAVGLNMREAEMLKEARALLAKKPEAVLRYLAGDQPPTKALVALALSAQLQISKQHLATMQVTSELCRFLKVGEPNTNDVENDNGQDATPGS